MTAYLFTTAQSPIPKQYSSTGFGEKCWKQKKNVKTEEKVK